MFFLLLMLHLATPQVVIPGEQADTFFQPKEIVLGEEGSFYILAKDLRLFKLDPDGQLLHTFGGKGQGPGQLNLGVAMLWIEETQSLWVADAGQLQINVFKDTAFERTIKVEATGSLLRLGKDVVLAPPNTDSDFIAFTPQGEVLRRFKTEFVFPEAHYQDLSLWRSFEAIPLQANRILLGFIWANKLMVIDHEGKPFRAWDMTDHYEEYKHNQFPKYFSQLGVVENADGTLWVMTCDHATKSCQELLLVDYQQKKVLGRATSDIGLRKITKLTDGRFAVIEADTDTVKIYQDFPFKAKMRR
jgi:hypothetical protein